jgi:shikimate dehydrogenase
VNTLTRGADGSLYGDNTDYYGFYYLLKKTGVNPAGGKIIILGSGGSSLAAQAVLRDMNAGEIAVISRSGADNYDNIGKHSDAVMIVNTTPVGMYPNNGETPLKDLSIFKKCGAVIDLIYNPARTELLMQAEDRDILCADGLIMLAAQAKSSAEQFARSAVPDGKIEAVCSKIAGLTRNIILIGMPGCGKSSVGAALAQKMNREFADSDEYIIKAAGKSIPAVFAEDGEEAFRRLESAALRNLCKRSGLIIATGGGVVTRAENRHIIRQNGTVFFLDRALGELQISGRPLSEKQGVAALAAVRLPLYSRWSDYTVAVCGVEQTAEAITGLWHGK